MSELVVGDRVRILVEGIGYMPGDLGTVVVANFTGSFDLAVALDRHIDHPRQSVLYFASHEVEKVSEIP